MQSTTICKTPGQTHKKVGKYWSRALGKSQNGFKPLLIKTDTVVLGTRA
jgi:hypothetical protein